MVRKKSVTIIIFTMIILFNFGKANGQVVANKNEASQNQLTYSEIIQNIESFRKVKANKLNSVSSEDEKVKIFQECRDFLFTQLKDNVFPAWYGTGWAFDGITSTPKIGIYPEVAGVDTNRIACGYFVTRILRKMEFKINPYRVAQQNSRTIVRNFVKRKDIFYSNNEKVLLLKNKLKEKGKGIYVVGLDCHVGFIVYDGANYFRFVHSSYYDPPFSVVSEKLNSFNPLNHSKGRIIGKLFDDEMIKKWLLKKKFELVTS